MGQTTSTGSDASSWLRPLSAARGPLVERGDRVVHTARRLGELMSGRPPGVTGHQWNTASRATVDFVVCDGGTRRPVFAVEFTTSAGTPEDHRGIRMRDAVYAAVGLEVLRIRSATLLPDPHGRRVVEYLIDARGYTAGLSEWSDPVDAVTERPVGFRDIVGRLPDGRSGQVNDLGAIARVGAVEAYVARQLVDPIVRGLHVRWQDGPAEGWAWVEVRPGRCLVERVLLEEHRFACGVDATRLAGDLAVAAIGERLRRFDAGEPDLVARGDLGRDFERLRARRDEMAHGFEFDHLTFD
ncbi:hypothetical protein GA0074692_1745 [Micromonospora pallida]|uniref:DUF2726 domain-containing protein n=1 Tax=Micromonospora pallida TaxID=145854 RepID=A0A1C6S4B8_9ACTN|nr:hypothetical protein [Micromonospora pallida]SCL24321.1 hypothetical protein GA0074692_1745 [Micromonospora pallida]